jgi:hypothetical protein
MKLALCYSTVVALLLSTNHSIAQSLQVVNNKPPEITIATTQTRRRVSKIALRIYDFDQVDSNTMAEARVVTTSIFRKAGFQVLWVECQREDRCTDADGPEFRLKIVPRSLGQTMVSDDSLGFAIPCAMDETACLFYIFNWRIKAVAVTNNIEAGPLLGHVLAHEIGHVLLGPNAHIAFGVMQHRLPAPETARILFFTSQQAKSMRLNLLERASRTLAWPAR